jgi:hypothetical protein
MRFLGITLMLVAFLALLLPLINANTAILSWADRWGEAKGFGIKAGLAFVGYLLWRFAPKPRR